LRLVALNQLRLLCGVQQSDILINKQSMRGQNNTNLTVAYHTYPRLQISGITRIEVGVIDVILRLAGGNGRGGLRARGRIAEALDSGHFVVLPIPRQNLEQLVRVLRSEQGRLTDLMANQHVHSCRAVRNM
jgi:hypothetical protein